MVDIPALHNFPFTDHAFVFLTTDNPKIVFYRDSREKLAQLTREKKLEVQKAEQARLVLYTLLPLVMTIWWSWNTALLFCYLGYVLIPTFNRYGHAYPYQCLFGKCHM